MGKEITTTNEKFIIAFKTLDLLLHTTELSRQVNWNLSKNLDKLESFYKRYTKHQTELLNKFVLFDENNKIRTNENGEPRFAPQKRNEYLVALTELLECEETIDLLIIKFTDLPEVLSKGISLSHIAFMIDDETE